MIVYFKTSLRKETASEYFFSENYLSEIKHDQTFWKFM